MNFFDSVFKFKDSKLINYGVTGLNDETNLLYIYNYFVYNKKSVLVLASTLYEATKIYQGLSNYTNDVLFFPMDEFIASEAIAISEELKSTRISTLNSLINDNRKIVVTCLMGYLRYLPSVDLWKNSFLKLSNFQDFLRDDLLTNLVNLGYVRESTVNKTGSFASMGYVIDVFSIGYDNPIRIEFFGDTITSIRFFDVNTQKSLISVDSIVINPYTEFLLDKYDDDVICKQKYLKNYGDVFSICSYLGDFTCFYYDYNQIIIGYQKLYEDICNFNLSNKSELETDYMFNFDDIIVKNQVYIMNFDNMIANKNLDYIDRYDVSNIVNYDNNLLKLKEDVLKWNSQHKTVIICMNTKSSLNKLYEELDLGNVVITTIDNIISGSINLVIYKIGSGFNYLNFVVVAESQIVNVSDTKTYKSHYRIGSKVSDISKIEKGDYIVHTVYGIGIYDGICVLKQDGKLKDYIRLIYSGSDSLYLPVEKIDRISRYSAKEGTVPRLSKLGTDDFKKKKVSLKKRLEDIATKLLQIYAYRESRNGYAFSSDDENQLLFDQEFEYQETNDQLFAIAKIKNEMQMGKPMDLLLCGDVGYGKTEVAFRAMFKAINDGKQVAYLCPTTILSNQQYHNALNRFKSFPVNIALLNRYVSKKNSQMIVENVKNGKVDILFGTHRILSKDIKFKDLGLLVIDEEQRFGVVHKEKIKEYKENVDVLTLSATPIPRTLQMSLAGIRSMALIETPPIDRYPIQTYVLPYNASVIKTAIYNELARGGQVFILYNKVANIMNKVDEISKMVKEARVSFAHGQMSKELLEQRMMDFIDYKSDVLVCTTIIETGIDIPNVNTLIVIDADCFGLSQLYQIRGRIGRSNKIGYAYLMYDQKKFLNPIAMKRLNTIKEFTELGSGFNIAMRDLSIRGAGDILGSEQSGFVDAIGIEMYLKLLNEAVDKIKGIETSENDDEDIKPLISVSTHINDNYTITDDIKIEIHKMINTVDSMEKLILVKNELVDRFGQVDDDMELYMYEEWFEKLARLIGIKDVSDNSRNVSLTLPVEIGKKIDSEKLFISAYQISRSFKLEYKHNKIVIVLNKNNLEEHFLIYLIRILLIIKEDLNL